MTKQALDVESARQGSAGLPPETIEVVIAAIRQVDYELWEGRSSEELSALVVRVYEVLKDRGTNFG